jgi:hypothetical protein
MKELADVQRQINAIRLKLEGACQNMEFSVANPGYRCPPPAKAPSCNDDASKLLTREEAADRIGMSVSWVRTAVRQGRRHSYLLDPADLDALIESSKTGAVAATKLTAPKASTLPNGRLQPYPDDWYKG